MVCLQPSRRTHNGKVADISPLKKRYLIVGLRNVVGSYLAFADGEGIPLWSVVPTLENTLHNAVVAWLAPYSLCVVILDNPDGTSLVAHDGSLAYAVTDCLVEA